MIFNRIQSHWDERVHQVQIEVDQMCIDRVRELVKVLEPFKIQKVLFGNGAFTIDGPDFAVEYEDESRGYLRIEELIYYGQYRDFLWTPVEISPKRLEALNEFVDLCDWWVDVTGGEDVTFGESHAH